MTVKSSQLRRKVVAKTIYKNGACDNCDDGLSLAAYPDRRAQSSRNAQPLTDRRKLTSLEAYQVAGLGVLS